MNNDELRNEEIRMIDIGRMEDNMVLIEWLVKRRLLRNTSLCGMCQVGI